MDRNTITRIAASVPRYTSYPTAPHFHAGVDAQTYAGWLADVADDARLSLYLHVPFCDRLCWFCACHTKQVQRYDPVKTYLEALYCEIDTVSKHLGRRGIVTSIHLGGGSPTMMAAEDMGMLRQKLAQAFNIASEAEISVEIDPNDMSDDKYAGLRELGITRASLGVQDFAPKVQMAINRIQTFEDTANVVARMRQMGVQSVNLDVLYGLPHQTIDSIRATISQILDIRPNRVALFGYAHVPWMKKHQTMIDETALPDAAERFAQSKAAAAMLMEAGYVAIGIDHFALPEDSLSIALAEGRLRRNFQGYTVDAAEALIGLGASSIGRFRQGHVQNMPATGEYQRQVKAGALATVRGFAMSDDDRAREAVIEKLMCEFGFSKGWLCLRHGDAALPLFDLANRMVAEGEYLRKNGDRFEIIETMQPFARLAAARFDAYRETGVARHSMAV